MNSFCEPCLDRSAETELVQLKRGLKIKRPSTGCPRPVATLKVRMGAFDALNEGS